MFKTLILAVLVLFSSQLAAEKVYKWVDENGQIHYSSQKPVDQEAETMKLKTTPRRVPNADTEADTQEGTTGEESTDSTNAEPDTEAEAAAKAAAKAKLAEADKINNKKQCDLARKNYNALNATVRVSRKNEKGETVRMTDNERVNALQTAQEGIKRYCK